MAKVNVCNVVVLNNPATFDNSFQFEITFDCYEPLPDDLEWSMVYVGSAECESYDQLLDTVLVGPVPEGRHMFLFQADPPDKTKLPAQEVVGVTVILLSCAYRGQKFIKVGYYVVNEYTDLELKENPPAQPNYDLLRRYIVSDQPRVTRIGIKWDPLDGVDDSTTNENSSEAAAETDPDTAPKNDVMDRNGLFKSTDNLKPFSDISTFEEQKILAAQNGIAGGETKPPPTDMMVEA